MVNVTIFNLSNAHYLLDERESTEQEFGTRKLGLAVELQGARPAFLPSSSLSNRFAPAPSWSYREG